MVAAGKGHQVLIGARDVVVGNSPIRGGRIADGAVVQGPRHMKTGDTDVAVDFIKLTPVAAAPGRSWGWRL